MKVLTIYAHHNPRSFCHAVLEKFSAGLAEAGHTHEVVDLHAIHFNPVLSDRDGPDWVDESVPDDVMQHMNIKNALLGASGNPLRRLLLKQWMGDKSEREILRAIHAEGPPHDVAVQQEKVAAADALVFIAPTYFVGFPAILKGWVERVFTLGFAFALKPEAWRGDIRGRLPLLRHQKALIISPTLFDEQSYKTELAPAMKVLIDDYMLRFPGIQNVEHVYFHAVQGASDETRRGYLERAYALGKDFALGLPASTR
jgi:NAD(P)H dehydrogenase (quinone)